MIKTAVQFWFHISNSNWILSHDIRLSMTYLNWAKGNVKFECECTEHAISNGEKEVDNLITGIGGSHLKRSSLPICQLTWQLIVYIIDIAVITVQFTIQWPPRIEIEIEPGQADFNRDLPRRNSKRLLISSYIRVYCIKLRKDHNIKLLWSRTFACKISLISVTSDSNIVSNYKI